MAGATIALRAYNIQLIITLFSTRKYEQHVQA